MRRAWFRLLLAMLFLAIAGTAPVGAQLSLPGAAATTPAAAPRATDPLGRDTPRKAILGFSRAAQREEFALAQRYVQLTRRQQSQAESLVRGLDELMDRFFLQPITDISDVPDGRLDDGLPPDRERVGPLRIAGQSFFIDLVRVDEAGLPVWLVSSETLAAVPGLLPLVRPLWLESSLPAPWSEWSVFGISLARFFVWLTSLVVPLLALHLLLLAARAAVAVLPGNAHRRRAIITWLAKVHWPVVVIGTLGLHLLAVASFGTTSLSFRIAYRRLVVVLLVCALAWGLQRLLGLLFAQSRARLHGESRTGARSLLLLGERLLKVVIVVTTGLAVLAIAGLDMRTTLAGLGIVGFAVALGARKTVENILGGVMLLGDEALAIGDECRVSGRQGKVEDISLRSVRLRTREQTLLSIPAGVLASADVENFASRRKFLANNMLRLSHRTSSQQMRKVREGIDMLLRTHPMIEQDSASIRLVGLGVHAVEFELSAYFLTTDGTRFLAEREELLLQIAGVVESAGAVFAGPCVATDA